MVHRLLSMTLVLMVIGCAQTGQRSPSARPGIDVLLTDSLRLVSGRRVGLLTNQTGVDRSGIGDLERLLEAGVQVTAIFSPEHGYRGALDQEDIGHGIDSATGIPIYSLYGATRSPTAAMLASLEVLLVDLQDIGARPYTYGSTMLLAMRAAQPADVTVLVLDRPNPVGGLAVQGPVLDTAFSSFVGMLPVAQRHGMTLGELALFGNVVLDIGAGLTVIPVAGWRRGQWFDETGLPWIRPSPNMPNLESATHYPGFVLFEATNLSVGRGTPVAFQVIAAPWLSPRRVRETVGEFTGVRLSDTTVTPVAPTDGKYDGLRLPALRVRVAVRDRYDPTATAIALLTAIRTVHHDSLRIDPARLDRLAGSGRVRRAVERGDSWMQIVESWRAGQREFLERRAEFLIYR
jgi:uncharacterized protein YbbC (DUF1343 family)